MLATDDHTPFTCGAEEAVRIRRRVEQSLIDSEVLLSASLLRAEQTARTAGRGSL